MFKYKLILLFTFTLSSIFSFSQTSIKGIVTDSLTNEKLAFVNIVYNNSKHGTTSDLDGCFTINSNQPIKTLKFSYVGYKTKIIDVDSNVKSFEINLVQQATSLDEVLILPSENPAHRIIKKVVENKIINEPEKLNSFTYTSYNKFIATVDISNMEYPDTMMIDTSGLSVNKDSLVVDSANLRLYNVIKLFKEQHLLLTETVSKRKYKHPDKNNEEIIANRVSGLKNPMFFMLATQLQSFSFYDPVIKLYNKSYLNPISRGSTSKYFFLITDTLYTPELDTVFVISYQPKRGKNFDALKGVLHINTNKYALQNVKAEPCESSDILDINIQQKYEYIQDSQWFPTQLNTNFVFNTISFDSIPLVGVGKSYISDIKINPEINNKEFDHVAINTNDDASKMPEEFWGLYRHEELSKRDLNTYKTIDSIGKAENFDRILNSIEVLATGQIPVKYFNIDLRHLFWYNSYEGYRLGIGLSTNDRLSKWFVLSGYTAYGFRDKAIKYGGNIDFLINKKNDVKWSLSYSNDVESADAQEFSKIQNILSSESIQNLFLEEFDPVIKYQTSFKARFAKYLLTDLKFSYNQKTIVDSSRYFFNFPTSNTSSFLNYQMLTFNARYAFKEQFMQTPKGNKISLGTNWPVLNFNGIYGVQNLDYSTSFYKLQLQVDKKFVNKKIGDTYLRLAGGYANEKTPYTFFYSGYGSYSWIVAENTFNTMRVNEFISNSFVHFFFKHDFNKLLFKTKYFSPSIALINNVGWSNWTISDIPNNYIGPYDKIYLESGIQINSILKVSYIGYGFAVYYRYGYYALNKQIDNFAFKLNITYSF